MNLVKRKTHWITQTHTHTRSEIKVECLVHSAVIGLLSSFNDSIQMHHIDYSIEIERIRNCSKADWTARPTVNTVNSKIVNQFQFEPILYNWHIACNLKLIKMNPKTKICDKIRAEIEKRKTKLNWIEWMFTVGFCSFHMRSALPHVCKYTFVS